MKVKNLNGTSDKKCRCSSWLQHWKNFTCQNVSQCRALGCTRMDLVGAHVKKVNSTDSLTYIVPFCKLHNAQKNDSIQLNKDTPLARANRSKTCDK